MKLKSAEKEAADCLKAFKNFKVGGVVVHCHHEEPSEKLSEPAKNRINYILKEKPKKEQALRLRLFRPVKGPARAEYENVQVPAWAEYEKVEGQALAEYRKVEGQTHKLICKTKDCPWNGKSIF